VQCEFDAYCGEPAAGGKRLRLWRSRNSAEQGSTNALRRRYLAPRQRMLEQRCHPFSKFLAGIAFELAAAQRISALATQWAAVALTPAPILAVSGAERILLLVGKTEFAARRTMINIPR